MPPDVTAGISDRRRRKLMTATRTPSGPGPKRPVNRTLYRKEVNRIVTELAAAEWELNKANCHEEFACEGDFTAFRLAEELQRHGL